MTPPVTAENHAAAQDTPGADDDEPVSVRMADLKAVFFVRDLIGDAGYKELKAFEGSPAGRKIGLTFKDGEYLAGVSFTYDAARDGFVMSPPTRAATTSASMSS